MKSVLISIRPYWVFLIIAEMMGWDIQQRKTVEVRKNYPKAKNWNKIVKIYCSKDKRSFSKIPEEYQPLMERFLGKVIGEFVCDTVVVDKTFGHDALFNAAACMTNAEVAAYCLNAEMYGWHISDLVIYDKPRPLSDFRIPCREYKRADPRCGKCDYYKSMGEYPTECACDGAKPVVRPPQSWCYVEELE